MIKILCFTLCLLTHEVFCVGYYPPAGAGALSMGSTGIMQSDMFCPANNCALMPGIKKPGIGFSFYNRYAISDLNQVAICAVLPYKKMAYGCELLSNGNQVLSDRTLGLSFAHAVHPQFSFGAGANYHFYSIAGYGSSSVITAELALAALINDKLSSSFAVSNPFAAKFRNMPDENLIRTFRLGFQYKVNPKVRLALEAEKSHNFKTSLKLGCGYQLSPAFHFSMGFSSLQAQCSFGFGFREKCCMITLASVVGFAPGISNNISFIYEFAK